MKKLMILTAACLMLTGCRTYNNSPVGTPYRSPTTGYAVVNNTGILLDVYQDGKVITTDMPTGQIQPLHPLLFCNSSTVIVTGHTKEGAYAGTGTYIFVYSTPEVWTVTRLSPPGTAERR